MLGIFLIYFIGKAFYNLAGKYEKHQWGYAIGGIVSYYIGTFVAGVIIAILSELGIFNTVDKIPDFALGIIAMPFGLLACWGFYVLIKRIWTKSERVNREALDGELLE